MSLKVNLEIDLGGKWVDETTLEAMIAEVISAELKSTIRKLIQNDTEVKKKIRDRAIAILTQSKEAK